MISVARLSRTSHIFHPSTGIKRLSIVPQVRAITTRTTTKISPLCDFRLPSSPSSHISARARLQPFTSSSRTMAQPANPLSSMASIDLSEYDPEQSRLMSERCIVVTPDDVPIGALDKKTCHLMENINKGLLHRAFSVFVFRPDDGKLLLQQRATEKITFPDMWTNTCCSHPLDDFEEEKVEKDARGVKVAATRKLEHELGIPPKQAPPENFQYLTRIHYLAPSDGLWGEHEVDYILFLTAHVDVTPNPNEIRDHRWVDKKELQAMFDNPGVYNLSLSLGVHVSQLMLFGCQKTRSHRGSS
ncbi:isopentenyl-diphosphate delta-isomerase idi1 [Tulasnella sp. JGI-2019a]|nr:isopentenyl-diphosphate delta-isomerase idi1 [Tulasnella sp. JGI-2019a]